MMSGFMASARAIATRCFWPPDSGRLRVRLLRQTDLRQQTRCLVSRACALAALLVCTGASITFSSAVMCGNRLKCWNTMPMC